MHNILYIFDFTRKAKIGMEIYPIFILYGIFYYMQNHANKQNLKNSNDDNTLNVLEFVQLMLLRFMLFFSSL